MTTREVTCSRCGQARWTASDRPYVCQRCRAVLAGEPNVVDPKAPPPSEAQIRAREAGARRLQNRFGLGH